MYQGQMEELSKWEQAISKYLLAPLLKEFCIKKISILSKKNHIHLHISTYSFVYTYYVLISGKQ